MLNINYNKLFELQNNYYTRYVIIEAYHKARSIVRIGNQIDGPGVSNGWRSGGVCERGTESKAISTGFLVTVALPGLVKGFL